MVYACVCMCVRCDLFETGGSVPRGHSTMLVRLGVRRERRPRRHRQRNGSVVGEVVCHVVDPVGVGWVLVVLSSVMLPRRTISFQSLYYAWKTHVCNYFYYIHPLFRVLFSTAGGASSNSNNTTAMVSASSDLLLRSLKEAGSSHDSWSGSGWGGGGDSELTLEGLTMVWDPSRKCFLGSCGGSGHAGASNPPLPPPAAAPPSSRTAKKDQYHAPLLIDGEDGVHLLHDYLLNQRFRPSLDAPTRLPTYPRLISPVAFLHARLDTAKVG